ncbi:methyl-accepting chemotaxis protein [Vibrio sonorensis]|uniref:methyl-accepting chemotaxis protein n=1 Tax=Vibrio sonorensis TaxID=1004316 RepID=UPI0008DB1C5B|nr:methyl-accepting chemotaxis protein [Vibrio sonorensis]
MTGTPAKMGLLSSLSIKAKLWIITAVLALGIVTYALYEQYSLKQLNQLQHISSLNLQSANDLLMLRRHEKDFLARKQLKYIDKFDKSYQTISTRVGALSNFFATLSPETKRKAEQLSETLALYQGQFHQLAGQVERIGLDSESGLLAQVIVEKQSLTKVVKQLNVRPVSESFFALSESLSSYLIAPSSAKQQEFEAAYSQLYALSPVSIHPQLESTQKVVNELFVSNQELGLSANEGMKGALRSNVHQTEQSFEALQADIDSFIVEQAAKVETKLHALGIVCALIVSVLLLLVGKSITQRIMSINVLMKDIAEGNGDLTVRIDAKGNDELAQLANSFDKFVSKLHGNIKDVANVMSVLGESSCSSESAAQKSMDNAKQQKAESESVATAVNELVMTSNEITANIEHAAETANRVKTEAEKGLQLTNSAGESLHSLTENILGSQDLVRKLEEQSREINSIIVTIQGIAEQTNLLALNAAIEAARAGDSGRGFAVVADEVRQLSLMTNNSTHQIESTITTLTDGIDKTVRLMTSSLEQANDTDQLTKQALDAIGGIVDQVSEMFDMNSQIATASEEQSMVSAEIDRNITQIAELAGDTHEVVSTSVRCSEQVADVSHKLETIVAQFKY